MYIYIYYIYIYIYIYAHTILYTIYSAGRGCKLTIITTSIVVRVVIVIATTVCVIVLLLLLVLLWLWLWLWLLAKNMFSAWPNLGEGHMAACQNRAIGVCSGGGCPRAVDVPHTASNHVSRPVAHPLAVNAWSARKDVLPWFTGKEYIYHFCMIAKEGRYELTTSCRRVQTKKPSGEAWKSYGVWPPPSKWHAAKTIFWAARRLLNEVHS